MSTKWDSCVSNDELNLIYYMIYEITYALKRLVGDSSSFNWKPYYIDLTPGLASRKFNSQIILYR